MSGLDEDKLKELMHDCQKIRNVALYDGTTEECFAFASYLISENEDHSYFPERARCVKRSFSLNSKIQKYHDEQYLFNVIDCPHIKHINRFAHSIHLVDGIVISADYNLELILEVVLRANIKPILFINNIDSISRNFEYDSVSILDEMGRIVREFNNLIEIYADIDKKEEWKVDINDGTVIFGSIERNFAWDFILMDEVGIGLEDIIAALKDDDRQFLFRFPIHSLLSKRIIEHLPSAEDAQAYRFSKLWYGDIQSSEGQKLMRSPCDASLIAGVIHDDIYNSYYCRVFGGTLHGGDELYLANSKRNVSIDLDSFDEVPPGNLVTIGDLGCESDRCTFDTLYCRQNMISKLRPLCSQPVFASDAIVFFDDFMGNPCLRQIDEPKSVGCGDSVFMKRVYSHMMEKFGTAVVLNIRTVHREGISRKSEAIEVHCGDNMLCIEVEPLEGNILRALNNKEFEEGRTDLNGSAGRLMQLGMDEKEAGHVWAIYNESLFLNIACDTDEFKDVLIEGFKKALDHGPLVSDRITGLKVKLLDAELHGDSTQVYRLMENAIHGTVMLCEPCLFEPIQKGAILTPSEYIDGCIHEIESRRGVVICRKIEEGVCRIEFEIPACEMIEISQVKISDNGDSPPSGMFEFGDVIRSVTDGKGLISSEFKGFYRVPLELQNQVVSELRQNKNLLPEPFSAGHYLDCVE